MAAKKNEDALVISRLLTEEGVDPLGQVEWVERDTTVLNSDGSTQFQLKGVEAPSHWSEQATTIAASKYLKRAESINNGRGETSIRDLIVRLVDTITEQGVKQGHLTEESARVFNDELAHMFVHQISALNSPAWFNCGLAEKYGIMGDDTNNFHWDVNEKQIVRSKDYFSHPQLSACFIQSIEDDLGDIWDHVGREGRIFKGGSGTGSNFSTLRAKGEKLSTGGTSSGVLSFLEVFDKVAGSTKSGGTNRRAAKMVILNVDHPEIEDFIAWKMHEEKKARILVDAGYSDGMDGEAYRTVSGQNSNNSVRVTDEFMEAVENDEDWNLTNVTDGQMAKTIKARDLFRQMCEAAWACADPGIQFDDAINEWHTCARTGRINASNPCSELLFLDDISCNLGSINLMKFLNDDGTFDTERFIHVCNMMIIAQEIIVDYASYPTREIAQNTHDFRPLGLGYTNLGALMMAMGYPYDSDGAREIAAAITSLMTGTGYVMSARLAELMGPFDRWEKNRVAMRKVINKHKRMAASLGGRNCPENIIERSMEMWSQASEVANDGFRNAQISLLAPTGTISFIMDADTTGVEPSYALIAFKQFAGGGYSKLVNGAVIPGLKMLGYTDEQINEIKGYITGNGMIPRNGRSGFNVNRLKQAGFTEEVIDKINDRLVHSPDVNSAIASVPETKVLIDSFEERSGYGEGGETSEDSPLKRLGFTNDEIAEANTYCCGSMTMRGAPHIQEKHLKVFECASSITGEDSVISPQGHMAMMEAVQPFLSGGISKTVNMSAESTPEDIWDIYLSAWKQGLKCVAVYRDGCKGGQPLSSKREEASQEGENVEFDNRPRRKEPPSLLETGARRKVQVDKYKMYIHAYRDEDTGDINEVWVNTKPGGGVLAGMMDFSMILLSMLLQYGVPLEELVAKFAYTPFEPSGLTTHPKIQTCRSIVDLIFRTLAVDFLEDDSYAQSPLGGNGDTLMAIQGQIDDMNDDEVDLNQVFPTNPKIKNQDDTCPNCGSTELQVTGTCKTCIICGTSLGCS